MNDGFEWKMIDAKTNEVVAEGRTFNPMKYYDRTKGTIEVYDLKESNLCNKEKMDLLDQSIDMALETNDKDWFMELTSQRNMLLKEVGRLN